MITAKLKKCYKIHIFFKDIYIVIGMKAIDIQTVTGDRGGGEKLQLVTVFTFLNFVNKQKLQLQQNYNF